MSEKKPLHIVCIGAGYVGGPTMAMIALKCPHITVTVFDISQSRIDSWNSPAPEDPSGPNGLVIYEPGLAEIVFKVRGRNLFFTSDIACLEKADIIFVAVNTPTKETGVGAGRAADLTYVESCARMIGDRVPAGRRVVVVEKSTVPVRCSISIKHILSSFKGEKDFAILSNPEFLAEGTAMRDLEAPDRVLIGGEDSDAVALLSSVYENWVPKDRIITTNLWSSELSKLVANALLAQRVSSINSITALCEKTGARVGQVRHSVGKDHRIGAHFLNASVGFGGSCFQKDILNLVYICESLGLHEVAEYWMQVIKINDYQKERFYQTVVRSLFQTVRGKTLAVYGFAFKKDTDDTRESAAIYICSRLLQEGARLAIYDPKVPAARIFSDLEHFIDSKKLDIGLHRDALAASRAAGVTDPLNKFLEEHVSVKTSALEAATGAAAIMILTEWDEFRDMDYAAAFDVAQKPAFIFDGRGIVDAAAVSKVGFHVFTIGEPSESALIDSTSCCMNEKGF